MLGNPQSLVSAEWLKTHLAAPDIRVLDASFHLPNAGRDARAEYEERHIPGAVFFDIDVFSDETSSLPHMAPPLEKFVSRVRALGVGDGHRVVFYDTVGIYSAARAWWLFRYFGHSEVAVLNGGLPAWLRAGGDVDDLAPTPRDRHFTPKLQSMLFRDVTDVSAALKLGEAQVVDARSAERFAGRAPEPRAGLRSGHIPGSVSLPFTALLTSEGEMSPPSRLRAAFETAGVDLTRPVITSCGSGVTAAVINLALAQIGHGQNSLYDGSWAEWGSSAVLPIAAAEDAG